jgi:hypothetical protein
MNLQSSTLMSEDTGVSFGQLQAEQIRLYREAWAEQGWDREPRVSVSRSVLPITEDIDRLYFGDQGHDDQVGLLGGVRSRFGKTYGGELTSRPAQPGPLLTCRPGTSSTGGCGKPPSCMVSLTADAPS